MFNSKIGCKVTTFFANMQVFFAKKCVFFDFLVYSVGVFAVIEDIFHLFVVLNRHRFGVDVAVHKVDILRVFEFDAVLVSDDGDVVKDDVVNGFAFESLYVDRLFGPDACDVAEGDVRPVGEEGVLVVRVGSTHSCSLVGIAG